MSKQEEIIEADIDKQMAETLHRTGTGCVFSEREISFIDHFHGTIEEAVARVAGYAPADESANKTQTDANKNEPTREQKADFLQTNDADKAAEEACAKCPISGRCFVEDKGRKDACDYLRGVKAGIAYDRERATKETFDTFLHTLDKRSGVEVADCRIVRVGDHNAVEVETDEYYSGLERFSDGDKVNLIIVKKEVQL